MNAGGRGADAVEDAAGARAARSPGRRALVAAAYSLVALHVCLCWLGLSPSGRVLHAQVNESWRARVPDMIAGTAQKPFVRRTLLPTTVRLVSAAAPRPWLRRLRNTLLRSVAVTRALGRLGWEEEWLAEYVIAAVLVYGCFLGFAFALSHLAAVVHPGRPHWLLPLLALPALQLFFWRGTHYLYDPPTLFLFTLGLALLATRRWPVFYPVFVLGLVNRETTCLLSLVFGVHQWTRLPRRAWLLHLSAQLLAAVTVEAWLMETWRDNPGAPFYFTLRTNIARLQHEGLDPATTLLLVPAALALLWRWRREPGFTKAALPAVVVLLAGYACAGLYGEVRVLYEAYPVLCLLVFGAACELGERLRASRA